MRKDSVLKKLKKIKKDEPFLITITIFDEKRGGEVLDTFLFANKFPPEELDGTKEAIAELIDKEQK
jgi:hypothetical protein